MSSDQAEIKIRANYFAFGLRDDVKENDGIIKILRELVKKYTYKKDLVKDTMFKHLVSQGLILGVYAKHNLIPTVGRTVLARRAAGDTTYSGEIDWGAIGTAVSPTFTNASTQLGSEQFRKQASSQAYDNNIAYIDWFIAAGDCLNATYTEFAAFIDGSITPNSGQAWSLLATGGWVKSQAMYISGKYTFN